MEKRFLSYLRVGNSFLQTKLFETLYNLSTKISPNSSVIIPFMLKIYGWVGGVGVVSHKILETAQSPNSSLGLDLGLGLGLVNFKGEF